MKQQYRQSQTRRLRKQPKMRRIEVAAAISRPTLTVPQTARQRRRRNNRRLRFPMEAIKRFVFSARWVSLVLMVMSVGSLVLIGLDEHFYLSVIPVEGAVSMPAAEVVQASGLASIHVFAADPNQAAAQIASLPGVISAVVELEWPNQVSIAIQEDSPLAIWQEGGQQFWITQKGTLIPARADVHNLLVIESEMPVDASTSEESEDGLQASLAFIPEDVLAGALMLRELRPNIDQLFYRPSTGLSYQDGRGWRVYFGTGTDMEQKIAVYETLVAELQARDLTPTYVSVSNQEKPYYMAR